MKTFEEERQIGIDFMKELYGMNLEGAQRKFGKNDRYFREWAEEIKEKFQGLDIVWGCTKIVFILDSMENWVIKVPFILQRGMFFVDHCEKEFSIFLKAKEECVDIFFAEVVKVEKEFEFELDFYLQKRAKCEEKKFLSIFSEYAGSNCAREEYDNESDYYDELEIIEMEMEDCEKVEAIFGQEDELFAFLNENGINDFHEGNFGVVDGCSVIIDYSGY